MLVNIVQSIIIITKTYCNRKVLFNKFEIISLFKKT